MTDLPNDHRAFYKMSRTPITMEERREKILHEMRNKRHNVIDEKRELNLSNENNIEISEADVEAEEQMDDFDFNNSDYNKFLHKKLRFRVMGSEWMKEVPSDLEENWLVKVCPKGKRILVVATQKCTKAFDKNGKILATFTSALPGGNSSYPNNRKTTLDCIYIHAKRTYYVLDVIIWNNLHCAQCTTDFRFNFLKTNINTKELQVISSENATIFQEIPFFTAELPLIENHLSKAFEISDVELPVDGILFYHKEMLYVKKITPLVCWLKPFMVPEVLNIPVHEIYGKRPGNYLNIQTYFNKIDKHNKELYLKFLKKKASVMVDVEMDNGEAEPMTY